MLSCPRIKTALKVCKELSVDPLLLLLQPAILFALPEIINSSLSFLLSLLVSEFVSVLSEPVELFVPLLLFPGPPSLVFFIGLLQQLHPLSVLK